MSNGYWDKALRRRIERRRVLASLGGAGAAAAFLAACGSDDDDATSTSGTIGGSSGTSSSASGGATGTSGTSGAPGSQNSGLLSTPVDTTAQATRGGTLQMTVNGEIPSLDIHQNYAPNDWIESVASRLLELEGGHLSFPTDAPRPGIASSWEFSPDLMTITMKLRDGITWHDKPPTNGRPINVDDIMFSWNRYKEIGGKRTALVNEVNPSAPLLSLETPDDSTIVAKLAYPIFYGVELMTLYGFFMLPVEAGDDSKFDVKSDVIGAGPYVLDKYEPSVGATLSRNPNYWEPDKPFMEGAKYTVIPEYSSALGQFKAGAIHQFLVNQEDVLTTKSDVADIGLFQGGVEPHSARTIFGWQTEAFRDDRVRQALSMSWNRDEWINVFFNTDTFESKGLPLERRWNTSFVATDAIVSSDFWLDPKDPEKFGDAAKYFQYNVEESKALLSAAGYPDGIDLPTAWATGIGLYSSAGRHMEVLQGMEQEVGFRYTVNTPDYQTEFVKQYRDAKGQFEGTSFKIGPSSLTTDPVARMVFDYSATSGVSFYGFGNGNGDPRVEDDLSKAQRTLDTEERKQIVHGLQRYLGEKMYAVRWPGGATNFVMAWPAVQNFQAWIGTGSSLITNLNWWLDETKPPLA